jgi:hypothetical protein
MPVAYLMHKFWSPSVQGDSWAELVKILVFLSPTSYTLTSSGFASLIGGVFYKFL